MVKNLGILSLLVLSSCAQVGKPTGGEKDTQPPVVMNAFPEIGATGINTNAGGTLTLEFDEYVNVRQLSAQLLVSPPLKKPVDWWMKGKEVTFRWNEDLEKNRTYVFQFGEAIVDIREGNPAKNLFHAFSTGESIDTLSLHGSVVDAFSNEAQSTKKIFLYDSTTPIDSILKGSLPKYVGTTDSKGDFTVRYIGSGEYKLIAIDDIDRNYQWTDGEALAISKDDISVTKNDTLQGKLRMQKTADTEVKYFVSSKLDSLGLLEIELSSELEEFSDIHTDGCDFLIEENTLWVWNDEDSLDQASIIWESADTLIISQLQKVAPEELQISGPTGKIISGKEIILQFNRPIISVIDSLISVTKPDSTPVDIEIRKLEDEFELGVSGKFGRGSTLMIDILPGAVTGWGEVQNQDSVQFKWSTFEATDLAELNVNINKSGWLELISANGTVVEKVSLSNQPETVLFKNLTPGSYALRWLSDENNNDLWDGVSIKDWREPESAILLPSNIKVKADWSHTLDWE